MCPAALETKPWTLIATMTTKMLDAQWMPDPTQPGRIAAGEAITIDVRVAFWRVPGGYSEEMRLVKETEALVVAAPAMAKALGGTNGLGHSPSRTPGEARLSCNTCAHFAPGHMAHCDVGKALRLAGLVRP